jgi:hypothetical protein
MALQLGTENKRQVYLLIALSVVIVSGGAYEFKDYFGSPATPARPPVAAAPVAGASGSRAVAPSAQGPAAQKITTVAIDPALRLDKLILTESVEYLGTGRNIFSAQSAPPPPRIEALAAGARPGQPGQVAVNQPPPPPEKPRPPSIDLRYFGYTQAKDKSFQAFLVHGDDIFAAKNGDIIDHRYKVGVILPTSVQITDLGYNNTQVVPLQAN